jgi:hypothetical protein
MGRGVLEVGEVSPSAGVAFGEREHRHGVWLRCRYQLCQLHPPQLRSQHYFAAGPAQATMGRGVLEVGEVSPSAGVAFGERSWIWRTKLACDNQTTAHAVADMLGIPRSKVMANVLPAEKASFVTIRWCCIWRTFLDLANEAGFLRWQNVGHHFGARDACHYLRHLRHDSSRSCRCNLSASKASRRCLHVHWWTNRV